MIDSVELFDIEGLVLIKPKVFKDARGLFMESFNQEEFKDKTGIDVDFVQDNESHSVKNTIRGLHFQAPPFAQAKLVRVVKGAVLDVVVDIRRSSKTYGQWLAVELNEDNHHMFYVPSGFAHGFACLSETCIFQYKCSNYYNKSSEGALFYADNVLNIQWGINNPIVSDKDEVADTFLNFNSPFA